MHERNIKVSGVELPIEELHFSFIANKLRTEYGFLESSRNGVPMTKDGQVLPLYTYPCIEWIDSMDFTGCNIFEFGVGFSSLFWSQIKDANVYGVEQQEDWFEKVGSVNDIEVYHEPESKNFIEAVHRPNIKFDVIIIDGPVRYDCVPEAIECVADDGMIILDNSDWHQHTKERLDDSRLFIPLHFHGFKPIHVDAETTSCYLRRGFSKMPKSIIPMGGTERSRSEVDKPL